MSGNNVNLAQPYYWYYATKEDALNWPIAPGNMLTFKDPDGVHYYEKSLGWSPYEGPKFKEFTLVTESKTASTAVAQNVVPTVQSASSEPSKEDARLNELENDISELKNMMSEFFKSQQNKQYYNNKKGDKQ